MIRQLYRVLGPEGSRPLNRLLVLQCAAAVLQGVAFALLVPVLRALLGPAPDDVWPWLTAFAGCALAHAVLQGAAVSGGFTVGSQLSRVLHQRMADQALRLPLGWFDTGRTAEFSRLAGQNVIQVMSTPAHLLRPFISSLLTPATLVAATFFFDVRTALVLLVCAPVLFAVQAASSAVMRRLDLGRDAAIGESADRVLEYARNQPVLRAFGRTAEGYGALDDALVAEARADRRLIARGLPGLVSFSFATRLVFALLLALGVSWQLDGSLTVPTLLALLVLLVRLIDGVSSAAEAGAGMRIARNTLERLGAVLDEPPFPQPAEPRTPRDASVEFDKVGFRYDGGADPVAGAAARPVLNDVTFRLPERSMTALVGPPARARPRSPTCSPASGTPPRAPSASAASTSARSTPTISRTTCPSSSRTSTSSTARSRRTSASRPRTRTPANWPRPRHSPASTAWSRSCPRGGPRRWARAARDCPADSDSACPSPARSSRTPRSSSSTRPPPPSTRRTRRCSPRPCGPWRPAGPFWSSRTG